MPDTPRGRVGMESSSISAQTTFVREIDCGEKSIQITQLYVGDVGCVVWDAAIVLCKFLENREYFFPGYWNGKVVFDLGSGTGVSGLAAGVLGAKVTVTDLPDFVPLMQSNIDLNDPIITVGTVTARTLVWGQDVSSFLPKPDVILMADVVYYEESLDDLLKTLLDLSDEHTTIIMSYEERTTGNKPEIEKRFFQLMESHFLRKDVPFEKQDETFRSHDIHIVMFDYKKESG